METLIEQVNSVLAVPLVAGAIGGLIRWLYHKESWRQAVSGMLIGAFVAHYISIFAGQLFESFAAWSQVDPASGRAAGAFLIGTLGTFVLQWFYDVIAKRFELKKGI